MEQPHKQKYWLSVLRASPWLIFALLATVYVAWKAPQQIGVLIWSLSKVSLGAYLGYWIDRSLFIGGRPHEQPTETLRCYSWLRRAIIIAAVIIGLGLGV